LELIKNDRERYLRSI